jgi:hypothetical protein
VLAAVIALHAFLAVILIVALRPSTRRSTAADFVSTLIIMRAPEIRAPSSGPHLPPMSPKRAPVMPVEPLTLPPPTGISPPYAPDTSIDWSEEGRHAASAAAEPRTYREFSHTPKTDAVTGRRPAHTVGEQYRLDTGEWIVWVSDRCYIVSGVPPIGLPDVLARSIPTSTVCQDNSPPPGELFKELPAYQKYHAAPSVK